MKITKMFLTNKQNLKAEKMLLRGFKRSYPQWVKEGLLKKPKYFGK